MLQKFLLLVAIFSVHFAIPQEWNKISLPENSGKSMTDLREGPDGSLYTLTRHGLFRSTDEGLNWSLVSRDAGGDFILSISNESIFTDDLVSHSINQATLSGDYNQTQDYTFNLKAEASDAVSFGDTTLFFYRNGFNVNTLSYKLLSSTDEGVTMTDLSGNLPSNAIKKRNLPFFITEGKDNEIAFHGEDDIFYRSVDYGQSFQAATNPIELFGQDSRPYSIDPVTGTYYAIGFELNEFNAQIPVVRKSNDHGSTWTDLTLSSDPKFGTKIEARNNVIILYGQSNVFYSTDGGVSWTDKTDMLPDNLDTENIFEKVYPDKFIITSNNKVFGLFDDQVHNGTYHHSLAEFNFMTDEILDRTNGIDYTHCNSISCNGQRLAAVLSGRAHYSDDFGTTWNKLKGIGANSNFIFVADNNTIYTSLDFFGVTAEVYRQESNDSLSKVLDNNGDPIFGILNMFQDDKDDYYIESLSDGFYKSSDGVVFTKLENAPINGLNNEPVSWFSEDSKKIYSFSRTGNLNVSSDYGITWIEGTLPGGFNITMFKGASGIWLDNFAFDETAGLYASTDGTNWTGPDTKNEPYFSDTKLFQSNTGMFYAVRDNGKVLGSEDGLDWSNIKDGLDTVKTFVAFVGTEYKLNTQFFDHSGGKVFLSSNGSIYARDDNSILSVFEPKNSNEHQIGLYPNPANDLLMVKSDYAIQSIKVSDLHGRTLLKFNNTTSELDVSNLSRGTYVLITESNVGKVCTRFSKQ